MNLKWTMVLCIIIASTLCGYSLAGAASEKQKFLMGLVSAVKKLRICVVDMMLPIEQALKQTGFLLFCEVADRIVKERSLYDAWRMTSDSGRISVNLSASEKNTLDELFMQLGGSGRSMQDELLCGHICVFEMYADEARERAAKVCRVYASIGFLTGMAIAILLV